MSNSVHYDVLNAVGAVAQGLTLAGLPASQVYIRKLPSDRQLTLPCVVVSLFPGPEAVGQGTNQQDDWGYPVQITIIQGDDNSLVLQNAELLWREQLRNAFHNKRLSGSPSTVFVCKVEPMPIVDMSLFVNQNLFVSAMIVRVWSRELTRP